MHKLIDTSTAAIPTGVSPQQKLFKIAYGPYAGRLVCLYGKSVSSHAFTWADPPYTDWSEPYSRITDSADYPLSACIDENGNLYVVYVQQTSMNLIFIKLTFSAGEWVSGSPVTLFDAGPGYYPVIARNDDGDLCCAFAYYDNVKEEYSIQAKKSTDGGITWGSGPSDLGTALAVASDEMPYPNLNFVGTDLYAVYCMNRSDLYFRKYPGGGSEWESEILLLSGDYIDSEFDCAVSNDMKLGIAFSPSESNRVYIREYDGVSLSGLREAATVAARAPQIVYRKNKAHIFFAEDIGNGYFIPRCAYDDSGTFTSFALVPGIGYLDKFMIYDSVSQTYEDKTEAASSLDNADVFHSLTGTLMSSENDCLYLGGDEKFFCLASVLSTVGGAGSVVWEYFDGEIWRSFTPDSGGYNFDESNKLSNLWPDTRSAPADWQINTVNSVSKFWIRIRVANGFTVAPVGTQFAATPRTDFLTMAREDQ
ncbi:MAG: hypothetical protein GY839_11655 [candidate division Zixibacteria bacterium]|nr:hypothetical protein [candidate division Zixibacteria bacterium]